MPKLGLTPDEIRAKAIEISMEKIRTLGVDKLRLSDVAKSMGVSHAALYPYFDGKAALLDAVVERWLSKSESPLQDIADSAAPVEERIVDWFVTLYTIKRERVLGDSQLFTAFDLAVVRGTPAAGHHLARLKGQLAGMVEELNLGPSTEEATSTLFFATGAFHHPGILSWMPDLDRTPELRLTLQAMLNGWPRR